MNIDNINKKVWEKEINKHVMLYPDDRIAAFMGKNYKGDNSGKKALDIGFGSGRGIKLFLDYGFDTYGIDYCEDCSKIAKDILGEDKNLKDLITGDIIDKPFCENMFDVIMIWGVIFLRTTNEIKRDLEYINRIMKKDAKMILNFRSKDNWFYAMGEEISKNTYHLNKDAREYQDAIYTFLDYKEAEELLIEAGFEINNSERLDLWKNNSQDRHSWWIFDVKKK